MGSSAEDIVERRTGILRLATGYNVRELCGYKTPWGLTLPHRFLRSGDTNELSEGDAGLLRAYGVTMDVDLRSEFEVTRAPDVFADDPRVRYHNASLYSVNMHDSDLAEGDGMDDYLVGRVSEHDILRDYLLSFASVDLVEDALRGSEEHPDLLTLANAMRTVRRRLVGGYGSVESYLASCGLTSRMLVSVRRHLVS